MNSQRATMENILHGLRTKGKDKPVQVVRNIRDKVKSFIKGRELSKEEWIQVHNELNKALSINNINKTIKKIADLDYVIYITNNGPYELRIYFYMDGDYGFDYILDTIDVSSGEYVEDFYEFNYYDIKIMREYCDNHNLANKTQINRLSRLEKLFKSINLSLEFEFTSEGIRYTVSANNKVLEDTLHEMDLESVDDEFWVEFPKHKYDFKD